MDYHSRQAIAYTRADSQAAAGDCTETCSPSTQVCPRNTGPRFGGTENVCPASEKAARDITPSTEQDGELNASVSPPDDVEVALAEALSSAQQGLIVE